MQIADKAYDELVDFFARGTSSAEILTFRPSAAAQQRASLLLERNRSGELTGEEADELERFGQLEHLMQLVKARAPLVYRLGHVTYVPIELRRLVRERAVSRCEYCLLSDQDAFFGHEPDHVIAEKHAGQTTSDNLAWACFDCNRFKGSDIASRDPHSGDLVPLFNPRTDTWREHFDLMGGTIRSLTPIGRATERLLKLNHPERVEIREMLARAGRYGEL